MARQEVTKETYIRKLPYSAVHKLISFLEPEQIWKRFVINIPKKMNAPEFEERYSDTQVRMIEDRGRKQGTYSTRVILDDWGTQNATVGDLLKVLIKSQLYNAADYISINVLKGERVPRQGVNNELWNGNMPQTSPEGVNLAQSEPEKSRIYNKDKINPSGSKSIGAESVVSSSGQNYKPSCAQMPNMSDSSDCLYSQKRQSNSIQRPGPSPDADVPSYSGQKPPYSSNGDVMSNSIEAYSSGNMSHDLKATPQDTQSSKETDVVSSTKGDNQQESEQVVGSYSQEIKYSVLRFYTDNFSERKYSEGGKVIGCGGFGTVYLATFPNQYTVAVKRLKNASDPIMLKQFETELKTLSAYKHENIVQLTGYSIDGPEKCLVYEYMVNGSLEDRLQCLNGTAPLSWQLRVKIAYGTAKGITYLNGQGLVHRDIKSANVLLDDTFVPKVGDFATARLAPSGCGSTVANTTLVIGTSAYMAPEAIRFDISAKLDSFAFGVVLLELLTGLPPNDNSREEQDLWSHVAENCDDSILDILDKSAGSWEDKTADSIFDIAVRCLKDRKKERVIVKDILDELKSLVPD